MNAIMYFGLFMGGTLVGVMIACIAIGGRNK